MVIELKIEVNEFGYIEDPKMLKEALAKIAFITTSEISNEQFVEIADGAVSTLYSGA